MNTPLKGPLLKPDRTGLGVAWWCSDRIFSASRRKFNPGELATDDLTHLCHCGRHLNRFPRCKFSTPRNLADVLANVSLTGTTAAGLIAAVSSRLEHFPDDILLSLGHGAGSCIFGWEWYRGCAVGHLFGVEIEPLATQVALATFPYLTTATDLEKISMPTSGRLVVITSLVMNLIDHATAAKWGRIAACHSDDVIWIDVGRDNDRDRLPTAFAEMISVGREREDFEIPVPQVQFGRGYRLAACAWR